MKNLIIFLFLFLFTTTFSVFSQPNYPDYSFTENKGQIKDDKGINHPEILFTGQGEDYSIYLRKNGWSYILKSYDSTSYQTQRVDIDFENSNPEFKVETYNKLPGYDNFPVRNNEEIQFVYSFSEVVYKDIYNGIDLRFYYDKGNLRYDYIVHPKANPNQISMAVKYSDNPTINQENGINIPTLLGEIRKEKPYAYQVVSSQKIEIQCYYKLTDNKIVFNTCNYDNSKELIIDPVSLVYGKLRRMKGLFPTDLTGITPEDRNYYSLSLAYNNIKRLADNSIIVLTNSIFDKEFIDEGYSHIRESEKIIYYARISFLPTIISKYDSLGNKEWAVSIYEKQNNLISWDANDSIIVVYSHSYYYYDSTNSSYSKNTVFVSEYNMQGKLLNRFELVKPDSIIQLIHPQQDDNLWNWPPLGHKFIHNYYESGLFSWHWSHTLSYEQTLKLINNKISLITLGRYPENNDSTYDAGLFLQIYNLKGNLEFSKELKHNLIKIRNNKLLFDSSSFDVIGLTCDFSLIRFLDDGGFLVIRNKIVDKLKFPDYKFNVIVEFYDNKGNLTSNSDDNDDLITFLNKWDGNFNLKYNTSYQNNYSFKIDKNKNFYFLFYLSNEWISSTNFNNLIKNNPYPFDSAYFHPFLLKFDSTFKLKWISNIHVYNNNYIIDPGVFDKSELGQLDIQQFLDNGANVWRFNYDKPWNTGTTGIIALDSIGNIFIPTLVDTLENTLYPDKRKLVITKMSPNGDVIWQDSEVLHFGYKYPYHSYYSSILRIKNADIVGNKLYLDYFVSNAQCMTPLKNIDKYELSEVNPVPNLESLGLDYGTGYYPSYNILYDLLFLKFNINENDLVGVADTVLVDTTCVGSTSTYKFNLTNKWHSKMIFDPPFVEGEGYSITPSGSFTLDTGKSKEFTILFSPAEFKTYSAKITFKQNNIGTFSNTINITGFTKATFLKSDSVWNLGTILINNTASETFTLYNNGNIGSWFWGIKDLPSEFKQILPIDNSSFIKPYDSINFKLEFTPTKAGIFEYKYKFITTIGCPDTFEITIRGRGVTESIELSSDSLDYGYLYSCETKTDTLFIENVANNPVTYQSADLTGLNPDNFNIFQKPADGTIMLRGNPLKFIVQFKPSGFYGIRKAILKINTSEKTIDCPLTGEYSEIKISANDIEMGYKSINVAYDLTIKITNNTKDKFTLEQAIPEDSRITVTTALPLDVPAMDSKDLAIQIKSATKGPLNPKVKLIFSGRCASELNSNINCKFDSASAEIASIDFGKVPYCENRIDSIAIKNTSKTIFKIVDIQFTENDGRFEFTGNDTYPLEIQAGNTYKKGIRYLAGVKQVSNNQAKVLITMEMNGKEQTFEILIKGERVIPDLSFQNLINLGQSKPGEIKTNDIEITNNGEDINISDVKINDNTNYQAKDYPKLISKNAKGNINISFSSDNIGSYATDMTVYFKLGECIDSLKININAEVKRLMTIWANNDTTDAGTTGYYVPIYAKTDLGANINGSNYTLNVKYLPEIYNSITSEDASILATTRDGSYEIVKVVGKFPEFKDSTEILFHLKGNVLFSTIKTTPIEIEYLNSEKSLAVTTIAGSLTITPVCINKFRGIQYYKPASMSVTPHPLNESSKINIVSQNRGLHVLELYSVSGERYEIASWSQSNDEPQIHELTLEKKSFPSGVYLLNLRMEWSNVQEVVVVVE